MSNEITTQYTQKVAPHNRAYSTATSKIGDVGVTATMIKASTADQGASYIANASYNQSSYNATSNMFYGNPDPASIPTLELATQDSSNPDRPLGSWAKINFNGEDEVATLTFKFDKTVTDPILDVSGLGGFTRAYASDYYGNSVARGSFNATSLQLVTSGVTMEAADSNTLSNLSISNNKLSVIKKNTNSKSTLTASERQINDGNGITTPKLEPSGAGSVRLKGTFNEVSFKLIHSATPFSQFSRAEYGTGAPYFADHRQKYKSNSPVYGDGTNGYNVINTETVNIMGYQAKGNQNADVFRASLRLPKPSSIGDTVWLDKDADGIQDLGEAGLDGVTVKLLDKDGNPAKDYNGNTVADQVTKDGGKYKFENLASGEYVVQVVAGENQKLTKQDQGSDDAKDSDVNATTGKTSVISLDPNTDLTDVDAGIVQTGNVTVKYVTEDGTELEPESDVKKDAPVGEEYKTEQKTFDGYEFVKLDENSAPAQGKVTEDDQTVVYVYKPVTPDEPVVPGGQDEPGKPGDKPATPVVPGAKDQTGKVVPSSPASVKEMPRTGSQMAGIGFAALALVALGVGALGFRRRHES